MSTNTITITVPTTNAFLTMKKQNKKTKHVDIESSKRDHSQTKHEVDIATSRNLLSFASEVLRDSHGAHIMGGLK